MFKSRTRGPCPAILVCSSPTQENWMNPEYVVKFSRVLIMTSVSLRCVETQKHLKVAWHWTWRPRFEDPYFRFIRFEQHLLSLTCLKCWCYFTKKTLYTISGYLVTHMKSLRIISRALKVVHIFFLDPPVCLGENLKQQSERRSENQQHDKEEDESS